MASLLQNPNYCLFALLPYVAVAAFVVLVTARRFGVPPFRTSARAPAQERCSYAERYLFGYGILVILAGHVLAFLIPEQVLLWNNDPLRRYILEGSGLIFALMTLVGLLLTLVRGGVGLSDWLLYILLLVQVASGIVMAVFYPWGSSWYATAAVPYLRSLVRLEPDLGSIAAMPHLVKLHVVLAWGLLLVLPFTRVVRPLVVRGEAGREPELGRLVTALLLVVLVLSLVPLVPQLWAAHLPGNQQGYEPAQPIAFSHRLHAGELEMSCLYCHSDAEKGRHAGLASATVCMNCHRFITAPTRDRFAEDELAKEEKRPPRTIISPELAKLYAALGLDEKLQRDPAESLLPIHWVKVHNLPAFTRFDHRAHVNAGVECQHCHGAVESMERVRQVQDLSMGWCVQCHRDANESGVAGRVVHPSNDCATCHH
jgi:nitrate reductase gamma subunit